MDTPKFEGILQAPILEGFLHGFTTRRAPGVSEGPFWRANYSTSGGDSPELVEGNFSRLVQLLGGRREELCSLRQVHSSRVSLIEPIIGEQERVKLTSFAPEGERVARELFRNQLAEVLSELEGDALISSVEGVIVGVKTADCVPILLGEKSGRAVAAIHAGWRGLAKGIIGFTIAILRGHLGEDAEFLAAIGPHICANCYRVGEEVAQRFPGSFRRMKDGEFFLDLSREAGRQLLAAGLKVDSVENLERCTFCEREQFFSYRRDGAKSGRMFNFIAKKL